MHIEEVALIQVKSIDEVLEDVEMSRSRHRDIINAVEIIRKALEETKVLRSEISKLTKVPHGQKNK